MEEDCGGGQGLTKGCGAKGRRRILSQMQTKGQNRTVCIIKGKVIKFSLC
jgi:hypothetical protein